MSVRCSENGCKGWCDKVGGLCSKHQKLVDKAAADKAAADAKKEKHSSSKCSQKGCEKWSFADGLCRDHAEAANAQKLSDRMQRFKEASPLSLRGDLPADLKLIDVQHLAGGLGSHGAYLCLTNAGVLVVKVATAPGAGKELLAHLLVSKLATVLPVEAPWPKFLRKTDPRVNFLMEEAGQLQGQHQDHQDGTKHHALSRLFLHTSPWIMLTEFLPGIKLEKLTLKAQAVPEKWREESLKGLGATLAVDMLLNNWDRFKVPGVWTGQGNSGNLLLTPPPVSPSHAHTGPVHLIDHTITDITDQDGLEKYRGAIRRLAKDASEVKADREEKKNKPGTSRRWSVELEESMKLFAHDTESEMVSAAFRSMQRWLDAEAVGSDVLALQETDVHLRRGVAQAIATLSSPPSSAPSAQSVFLSLLEEAKTEALRQIASLPPRPLKQPKPAEKGPIIAVAQDTPQQDEAKRQAEIKEDRAAFQKEVEVAETFVKLTFQDIVSASSR